MVLDEIDRRILQLEMERLSLKSDYEGDEKSGEKSKTKALDEANRLQKIDSELTELKQEQETLSLKWKAEKGGVNQLKEIKEKMAGVELEIEKCEREFDLNRAAELK